MALPGKQPLLVGGVLALAVALVVWLLVGSGSEHRETAVLAPLPGIVAEDGEDADRVRRLEDRVSALAFELDELRSELAARRTTDRDAVVRTDSPRDSVELEERDPRWYLEQYVASFADGGEGMEYYRLCVEVHLPTLLREVCALVRASGTHPELRRSLVRMLGSGRFLANGVVVGALRDRLRPETDERTCLALVEALGVVATAADVVGLEACVWSLGNAAVRDRLLQLLVELAGEEANRSILRLLATAPDDVARAALLGLLSDTGGDSALDVFQAASRSERATRLLAAQRIGEFRRDVFRDFVQEWLAFESDEAVRQVLGASSARQREVVMWHAEQAAGPPDTADPSRDSATAWASARPDDGPEWLELTYDRPMRAHAVRIHEVCRAGAVSELEATDVAGVRRVLWSGTDPTTVPGVFEVGFPATTYEVRALRVVLDTSRASGWNEIDAVELLGPNGRAWASSARASSYYGQATARR